MWGTKFEDWKADREIESSWSWSGGSSNCTFLSALRELMN